MAKIFLAILILSSWIPCASQGVEHCLTDAASVLQQQVSVRAGAPNSLENSPHGYMGSLIPPQLVMTGYFRSLDDNIMPPEARSNLRNTLAHAQGLKTRYLNDASCHEYIKEHFDADLLRFFDSEKHGSFRGDICRSAVLLREGGFYADLDFQLHVPLRSLIDKDTTLMTAFTAQPPYIGYVQPIKVGAQLGGGYQVFTQPVLNALIAVRPNSTVMERTIKHIKNWYTNEREGLLGPLSMAKAVGETVQEKCPTDPSKSDFEVARWTCGSENFRFYEEENLGSGPDCVREGQTVCPAERATSSFDGLRYGVFAMGDGSREQRLIGWPRYLECFSAGCLLNGGIPSF